MRGWALAALLCLSSGLGLAAAPDIKIGMANALSGPAAGLGWQLRAGASAYIDKVNAAGGVHGRKISLISVDDSYDPQKSIKATQALIDTEQVVALFGYVGTPTSAAVVPIAAKAGVPYLFPFTGAEFLRQPVSHVVFNLRASYYDEAEALVARLTGAMAMRKIALFIQDDEFGEAGKAGVKKALARRDLAPVAEARYQRNTVDVEAGLAKLKAVSPDAVVFIGTYRPLAALVKTARATGMSAKFLTVSFVGTSEFIKHAGPAADGVIISQVMPSPEDASDPLVKLYHHDVAAAARNYGSLEGYADAMLLVEALQKCGRDVTRASLLKTLDGLSADIGGMTVAYSSKEHQGSNRVFLTQVKDGKAMPIGK